MGGIWIERLDVLEPMTMRQLLLAASIAYEYGDEDKAAMRAMALDDRDGVERALRADPWLPWVAFEHGITDQPPTQGD